MGDRPSFSQQHTIWQLGQSKEFSGRRQVYSWGYNAIGTRFNGMKCFLPLYSQLINLPGIQNNTTVLTVQFVDRENWSSLD